MTPTGPCVEPIETPSSPLHPWCFSVLTAVYPSWAWGVQTGKIACWAAKSTVPSTYYVPDTSDTEATKTSNSYLLPARNLKAVVKEILNAYIYRSVQWWAELSSRSYRAWGSMKEQIALLLGVQGRHTWVGSERMCKSWVKEVYREKGSLGVWTSSVVQNCGLVLCKAETAGDKPGEANRDLCGWFSSVHFGNSRPWEGNTYPALESQLR